MGRRRADRPNVRIAARPPGPAAARPDRGTEEGDRPNVRIAARPPGPAAARSAALQVGDARPSIGRQGRAGCAAAFTAAPLRAPARPAQRAKRHPATAAGNPRAGGHAPGDVGPVGAVAHPPSLGQRTSFTRASSALCAPSPCPRQLPSSWGLLPQALCFCVFPGFQNFPSSCEGRPLLGNGKQSIEPSSPSTCGLRVRGAERGGKAQPPRWRAPRGRM